MPRRGRLSAAHKAALADGRARARAQRSVSAARSVGAGDDNSGSPAPESEAEAKPEGSKKKATPKKTVVAAAVEHGQPDAPGIEDFYPLCQGCAASALSGRSAGRCLPSEKEGEERCRRCAVGSHRCKAVPLRVAPFVEHLRVLLDNKDTPRAKLDQARSAVRVALELFALDEDEEEQAAGGAEVTVVKSPVPEDAPEQPADDAARRARIKALFGELSELI